MNAWASGNWNGVLASATGTANAYFLNATSSPFTAVYAGTASGYAYYNAITVTSTASVASGTLTNFPMLFSGTYSWLAASSSGGTLQNGNGYDMTFASSPSCSPSLNFQIENYVSSTGAITAWVQVPTMSTGTVIYLCYDNATISTSQQNATGTWDSNYVGVWHFPSATSLNASDSTSFANNLTASGTVVATSGFIGTGAGAASFANTSYLREPSFSYSTTTMTAEAWAYSTNFPQNQSLFDVEATNHHWELFFNTTGLGLTGGAVGGPTSTAPSNSNWHFLVGVWNGTSGSLYVDGALAATKTITAASTTSGTLDIGAFGDIGSYGFTGSMQELRLSRTVRSSQWLLTEYNNENSPNTFYAVGGQVGGVESIPEQLGEGTTTYNRYFYLSDVYRDSNGNVTTTAGGSGVFYDPSTKLVTVVVRGTGAAAAQSFTFSEYITRNGNNNFSQTSWSGGSGQTTPVTIVGTTFAASTNTAINASGAIQLYTQGNSCVL